MSHTDRRHRRHLSVDTFPQSPCLVHLQKAYRTLTIRASLVTNFAVLKCKMEQVLIPESRAESRQLEGLTIYHSLPTQIHHESTAKIKDRRHSSVIRIRRSALVGKSLLPQSNGFPAQRTNATRLEIGWSSRFNPIANLWLHT